jgi:ABC-type amino acid transport substrate-binding protein
MNSERWMPQIKRIHLLHAVIVALLVIAAPAQAQKQLPSPLPEIEWGYPEQAPRAFTNSQGQADGHYARLLNVLFKKAGMSWHGASYPAKRLMSNLESGETNFSILVKNPVLDKCCIYSRNPVWNDELRVYYQAGKMPIRKKEDLVGKQVITLAGFAYGGLITFITDPQNQIQNHIAQSHAAAFQMLEAGRADYVLDYAEPVTAAGLSRNAGGELHSDVLDTVYMYFVISRSYPNASAVLDRLEAIYKTMRDADVRREYTK